MKATRQTVHFRFNAELNELLAAASSYLGITKTDLVEKCIRLNLDKVVKAEEAKNAVAAKRFKRLRNPNQRLLKRILDKGVTIEAISSP